MCQSAEHGRTQRDLARARKNSSVARRADLIFSGAATFLMIPHVARMIPNVRVQGLFLGVQFNLLQIVICVQVHRSADWPM